MFESKSDKHFPDRPFECSECKKTIAIRYTEIVDNSITQTSMCNDCPELQKRLHGTNPRELLANIAGAPADLACGNCGTTLEEIKRGHRLGCSICYSVFEDVLFMELQAGNRIPPRMSSNKKGHLLHIGRSPGETLAINPSSRLLALNEALKETLNREDYEQAAFLRDQIKELTETGILKDSLQEKEKERKQDEPPFKK